jgi:predicted nuclease of predicted toxin-antitoxin system
VKIWTDAQFPPLLAGWITKTFQVESSNLDALGLCQASDADIFQALRTPGQVIMTRDEDFVDLVTRLDPPPQVLWVTSGNLTNRAMGELLTRTLPAAMDHFRRGEPVVEIR